MDDERKEMSVKEQIVWYLDRLSEKHLQSVLLYVFKLFLRIQA